MALREISRCIPCELSSSRELASVIVSITTIIEGYVDGLVDVSVRDSPVGETRFGALLIQDRRDDFKGTWKWRFDLLRVFSLQCDDEGVRRFRLLIELRNAIVHGGGSLTDRQAGSLVKQLALQRDLASVFCVDFDGRRCIFDTASVRRSIDVGCQFVLGTDELAMRK